MSRKKATVLRIMDSAQQMYRGKEVQEYDSKSRGINLNLKQGKEKEENMLVV